AALRSASRRFLTWSRPTTCTMPRRLDATVCVSEALMGACASVAGFTAAATFRFVSDEPLVEVEAFAGAGFVMAGADVLSSLATLSDLAAVGAPLVPVASTSATFAAATWVSTPPALLVDGAAFPGGPPRAPHPPPHPPA